ncbi:MAG TPA: DUF1080 domain-containing protein, partial [Planctomycetota bacterium]|nr:DUF1080 domain-containing protein [Planctomycetota bacterium]
KILTIAGIEESDDQRSVHLIVPDRRAGYVNELKADGVRNAAGLPLLHSQAYYTLVNIPGGESIHPGKATSILKQEEDDLPWHSLFDGQTTRGWESTWSQGQVDVRDGEIHLTSPKGMFFLVSEEEFSDFILEAEVRIPSKGNSGIQFRSQIDGQRMRGYQAEVDPTSRRWAGGLYDQNRRAWLHPLTGDEKAMAAYRAEDWNHYRIECRGHHIRILLNGVLTTETYDPLDLRGRIGLQHHGEAGLTYRFRGVRIKRLGNHEYRPVTLQEQEGATAIGTPMPLKLQALNAPLRKRWELETIGTKELALRVPYRLSSGELTLSVREEETEREVVLLRIGKDGPVVQQPNELKEAMKDLLKKATYDPAKPHFCDVLLLQSDTRIFLDGIQLPTKGVPPSRAKRLYVVLQVELQEGGQMELFPIQKLEFRRAQAK